MAVFFKWRKVKDVRIIVPDHNSHHLIINGWTNFPTHSALRGLLPWGWTSWACRTAVRRSPAGSGRGGCRRRGRRAGGAPPPPPPHPPPPSSPHPGPRSHPPFRCSSPCCSNLYEVRLTGLRIRILSFSSVLWIRDILVRIRIRGYLPTDLWILLFLCQWLSRCQQKRSFFQRFFQSFLLISFWRYIYINISLQR